MQIELHTLARALGGVVSNSEVHCPGPNHSKKDRSLSVRPDANAPDGFVVHCFSPKDDPIRCRDYVREKLNLPAFKPNGRRRHTPGDALKAAVMAAGGEQSRGGGGKIVAIYNYTDADGELLYQVLRLDEPKNFRQRRPDGNGGWIPKLEERRVLYRMPDLLKYPDGTIFFCEGEKDADRVAGLGHCATTVACGKLTDECVKALAGRDVIILEDNDDAGRAKALAAAQTLHGTAKTIRIVSLPDLPDKGDISDWLDADPRRAEKLVDVCFNVPIWTDTKREQDGAELGPTWPDPDFSILDDRRGDLPAFPIDVFSTPCQAWLKRAAAGAGTTVDHVAVPLLGVVSALIGTSRRIQATRSWLTPCTMWMAVVGFSGTGKTPGLDVTRTALSRIESTPQYHKAIDDLRRAHETRVEKAKAELKQWEKQVKDAVEANKQTPSKPVAADVPGAFVVPRLFLSNVTIERVAALLEARPRGILGIYDELAGLLLNMSRYSSGQDNEFWLESWNGKRYVIERVGRPPDIIPHLLIGVVGGLQPDKLARCFKGDEDGMYARFCFAWPEEPGYQPLTDDVQEAEPEIINALGRIIGLKAEDEGVFASRVVPLTDGARQQFEQFLQFVHHERTALDGRERDWLAKSSAHVLRLAGTLAFLDWAMTGGAEPKQVEPRFVLAAARLVRDYFRPHARAALRQIGLSERHVSARRILRWVKAKKQKEISVKDVRRDALGGAPDAEQTLNMLTALVNAGWLHETTIKTGGRDKRRWTVNPILFSSKVAAGTAETATSPESGAP